MKLTARQMAQSLAVGSALLTLPFFSSQVALAQTPEPQPQLAAPTARYARGEAVDLAEIVSEWRGYYEDVPIYLCVCQDDTCDQTEQWPYREYARYQLGVALGPTNGRLAEDSGANCFDITDNSRPNAPRGFAAAQIDEAAADETPAERPTSPASPPAAPPSSPASPPASPPDGNTENADSVTAPVTPPTAPASPSPAATGGIPTAIAINQGEGVRLTWPSGTTNDIAIAGNTWNINILDAVDCNSTSLVASKTLSAQRVVGEVAVDSETGNVAIPVLLDSCVETDQSAVFILDPSEGGGYTLYRTQLPGDRSFPNEFSSYAFSSILDVSYGKGLLYVQQGTASGAESVVVFRADRTPAGTYAGCALVNNNEGASRLCPTSATP